MLRPYQQAKGKDMNPNFDLDSFLPPAEVAKLVGCHVRTLRRWERTGHFPKRRLLAQHKVGYLVSEVRAWIESRREADLEE